MADPTAEAPQTLTLRWGALAVLTPFPLFVGGSLQMFLLGEWQLIGALSAGVVLGTLGLLVVWTAPPGALGSVLGLRFRAVPVGLCIGWAIALGVFNILAAGRAMAWLAPTLTPLPGVLPLLVLLAGTLIAAVVVWQRLRPAAALGIAFITVAAWLAILPNLVLDSPAIRLTPSELPYVSTPFPASAAHIYLVRLLNVAGIAAATVLLAAPLAGGVGPVPRATHRAQVASAVTVGAVVLTLMYIGLHVGGIDELMGGIPAGLRAISAVAIVGGIALWGNTVVAAIAGTSSEPGPTYAWRLPIALAIILAAWLAPAYDTSGVVNAEWLLLALGYILAPWLGLLAGQRLMHGGTPDSGYSPPVPAWAALAWVGGLVASLPGIVGFGLFGGGPFLESLLPSWRFMRYLHPQADWAMVAGFSVALAIYIGALLASQGIKPKPLR